MAGNNDGLSSLLAQKREAMEALAIETREKYSALSQGIQEDLIAETQKKVNENLSALEKQVNGFLESTKKRLERELAQQFASSITNSLGLGGGSSSNIVGQSQGQLVSAFSNLLQSAWRNL